MDRDLYERTAAGEYLDYQTRYRTTLRESDRVIVETVRRIAAERGGGALSLVDIGCSTGNLLLHLKRLVPGLRLHGGDVYPRIVESCRADPDLAGIGFDVMDILALEAGRTFDIVVVNAVLWMFGDADLERALSSLARIATPRGHLITFELFHQADEELEVVERSRAHPDGLLLHFRPIGAVRRSLERAGFVDVQARPFRIPIDLPRSADPADITSYTVRAADGERLIFRGMLYTPWCHLTAVRAP